MDVGLGINSIERLAWAFINTRLKLLIPAVLKLWEFNLLAFTNENLVLFFLVLREGINFLPLSSNIFLVIPLPLLFSFSVSSLLPYLHSLRLSLSLSSTWLIRQRRNNFADMLYTFKRVWCFSGRLSWNANFTSQAPKKCTTQSGFKDMPEYASKWRELLILVWHLWCQDRWRYFISLVMLEYFYWWIGE